MRIAVQTRPWGVDRNRDDLAGILAEIAGAGYDGFEIGNQHLDLAQPDRLRALADAHGLAIAGIHAGGEISDPDAIKSARAQIERIADFIVAVGASIMPFSGQPKPDKSPAELQTEADNLNMVGELCAKRGVTLCYHNHNWEIVNDCAELQFLMAHTDPALVSLCLDVGWVQRAGGDPLAVVNRFADRIGYFHLKDTTADDWRELGNGEVDLPPLLAAVKALAPAWATVEQDTVPGPAVDSAQISRTFLRQRMGW